MVQSVDAEELQREAEWLLAHAHDPAEALPVLHRLARVAPPNSEPSAFAHRSLAELIIERDPWRAAIFARTALRRAPDDDRTWAVLALAHTLMGHFRSAERAYREAMKRAPQNGWYAHNLGHLLDVALDDAPGAVALLELAHAVHPTSPAVVASFVHALARAGHGERARAILASVPPALHDRELRALSRWLQTGARGSRALGPRPPRQGPGAAATSISAARDRATGLRRALTAGLEHLPFTRAQHKRALRLAGAVARASSELDAPEIAATAAAIAHVIVDRDAIPLSTAEVAAPFRVGIRRLRGRLSALHKLVDVAAVVG